MGHDEQRADGNHGVYGQRPGNCESDLPENGFFSHKLVKPKLSRTGHCGRLLGVQSVPTAAPIPPSGGVPDRVPHPGVLHRFLLGTNCVRGGHSRGVSAQVQVPDSVKPLREEN